MSKLKIGLIGLDTSHVLAFTKLLNNEDAPFHVPGGKVILAFPGGSDMELSHTRVDGYTKELSEQYGIKMVQSPEEVAEECDAILLESVDGRVHLEQFETVAPYGKPVFVDKPLTTTTKEAKEIFQLAKQYPTKVMSCSSLRFAEGFSESLSQHEKGEIIGVDCSGPLALEPTHDLFWYGIHTAEMLFRSLGTGCKTVTVIKSADHDVIVGEWKDGRIGSLRGNRKGNTAFGALIHKEKGSEFVDVSLDQKPYYACLLEEIIAFFHTGLSPIDEAETVEIIRFLEAANESRSTGSPVAM
ncbi:Gfo/Idh/MocA family oxidoreductase [Lederbergia sp. NSJ-179]|uniref:Gfo/Idh/MocA family protein n=1 Tax=Lederbergia sp. NSJ-179 TaxID=2931402 RepID=UPI001FD1342E|nr:Gfo/Idh/MocA family oxidoreductase [Lederbergia sp. NSJ-179]MCJ7841228.1 Gfo/Idh/MocA family oxidoreductase [Lederbergia sp. NSJ-179]